MKEKSSDPLLSSVGERIRAERIKLGLRIVDLSKAAGLSARFISDVEHGKGNISIMRLNAIAVALKINVRSLLPPVNKTDTRKALEALLDECSEKELVRMFSLMGLALGRQRPKVIALLGIRGAGKSTVGAALAKSLEMPFVELVDRIEHLAGISQSAIFSFHGEGYYRRLEKQAMRDLIDSNTGCVVALPGGIVTHTEVFEQVKETCFSIWLRATPEEYLGRVFAQGDMRPMEGRADAMVELRRLVTDREALYAQANFTINTSGKHIAELVELLGAELESNFLRICPFVCEPI